jgi:pimeloyl-ACP methyl ester carboxylesterase
MPRVAANSIQIHYESFGAPGAPTVLLIMGLGAQLTRWNVYANDWPSAAFGSSVSTIAIAAGRRTATAGRYPTSARLPIGPPDRRPAMGARCGRHA